MKRCLDFNEEIQSACHLQFKNMVRRPHAPTQNFQIQKTMIVLNMAKKPRQSIF